MYYDIVFLLFVGFILTILERKATHMLFQPTGFMTAEAIARGKYKRLPGAYRCLSPWIQYFLLKIRADDTQVEIVSNINLTVSHGKGWEKYVLYKFVSITSSLLAFYFYIDMVGLDPMKGALIYGILVASAYRHDYNDCWLELSFLSLLLLSLHADIHIAAIGILTLLSSLNRETAIVHIPITYLYTNSILYTLIVTICYGIGQLIPRIIYGFNIPRSGKLFRLKQNIIGSIAMYKKYITPDGYKRHERFLCACNTTIIYLICLVVPFIVLYPELTSEFKYLYLIFIVFGVAVSIPGSWAETRIYYPLLFVIVPLLLQILR